MGRHADRAALLACLLLLASCTAPVITSERTVTLDGNALHITSGTLSKGRFVLLEKTQLGWQGNLEGGKEQWTPRSEFLYQNARKEIADVCGEWFVAVHKGPIYNMLDRDETMGGMAPVLGVAASMVAYLAANAQTKDENVPTSVYMEFSCQDDAKQAW